MVFFSLFEHANTRRNWQIKKIMGKFCENIRTNWTGLIHRRTGLILQKTGSFGPYKNKKNKFIFCSSLRSYVDLLNHPFEYLTHLLWILTFTERPAKLKIIQGSYSHSRHFKMPCHPISSSDSSDPWDILDQIQWMFFLPSKQAIAVIYKYSVYNCIFT